MKMSIDVVHFIEIQNWTKNSLEFVELKSNAVDVHVYAWIEFGEVSSILNQINSIFMYVDCVLILDSSKSAFAQCRYVSKLLLLRWDVSMVFDSVAVIDSEECQILNEPLK